MYISGFLSIRVSDRGGGMSPGSDPWHYFFSTAKSAEPESDTDAVDEVLEEVPRHMFSMDVESPLAGHGCGLPLSREA